MGTLRPTPLGLRLEGNVGLDELIGGLSIRGTASNPISLFNHEP
ncbi:hypothetical protein [Reticulibacter mediterranei]|nr:hypothetical protein [Reticulibacter mediterranei]